MPNRDVKIRLIGQDLASGAIGHVRGQLSGLGNSIAAWGTGLLTAGAAISVFKSGLEGLAEEQAAIARLDAVIRSTGGAAGLSSEQIRTMASDLQRTTTFADDVTISASAVLATFKQIKGDTFREAMMAAQDMSTVMGQDLQSSVVQIGKALNDPVKGITALTRVGVSFTAEQKEMIETLAESNQVMDAQKMILAELRSEFGGAAANEAKTLGGELKQLANDWGDLKEAMAEYFTEKGGRTVMQGLPMLLKPQSLRDVTAAKIKELAATNPNLAQHMLDSKSKPGGMFEGNALGVELQMAISQGRRQIAADATKEAESRKKAQAAAARQQADDFAIWDRVPNAKMGLATMFGDALEQAFQSLGSAQNSGKSWLAEQFAAAEKFATEQIAKSNMQDAWRARKAARDRVLADVGGPLGAVESRFLTRGGSSEPPMVRELREANRIARDELKETREQNRHLRRIAEKRGLSPANF